MGTAEAITIPETVRKDLDRAVHILKEAGCVEVFLFGSAATGQFHEGSDLDLAITGCPRGQFFHLFGKLMIELEHPVDLVDLDMQAAFAEYLRSAGALRKIG